MESISVERLHVRYDDVEAVRGITFSVDAGEVYGLLGRNGAGKTSTISAIAGLLTPWAGECDVRGRRVVLDSPALRQTLALQPQKANLFPRLRVRETLEMWAALYPSPRSAAELVGELGLQDKAETRVSRLSGGQRQRLLIGTALVGNTPIVVLDEPTTGLDPHARHAVWAIIRTAQAAGTTFLLSTHAMDEAEELCDRLAIMHDGQFVAEGAPADLVAKHAPGGVVKIRSQEPELADALRERFGDDAVTTIDGAAARSWTQVYAPEPYKAAEWVHEHFGSVDARPRLSNLEDVFLKLTGTSLTDEGEETEE